MDGEDDELMIQDLEGRWRAVGVKLKHLVGLNVSNWDKVLVQY